MNNMRNGVILLVFGNLLLAGCRGRNDRPELGLVTGTVTMDGTPLPHVLVSFGPTTGRASTGVTDNQGRYKLDYLFDMPGAKAGSHQVTITTFYEDQDGPEALNAKEQIPTKYNSKTTLTVEVKTGTNLIDFDLTLK